jgi:hypothetical protein
MVQGLAELLPVSAHVVLAEKLNAVCMAARQRSLRGRESPRVRFSKSGHLDTADLQL